MPKTEFDGLPVLQTGFEPNMEVRPSRYDDLCVYGREKADAHLAALIVMNGNDGTGFSLQAASPYFPHDLADVLEDMARKIREQSGR